MIQRDRNDAWRATPPLIMKKNGPEPCGWISARQSSEKRDAALAAELWLCGRFFARSCFAHTALLLIQFLSYTT